MGIKQFFIKQALKMKGMKGDEAEKMAEQIANNPELVASMKKMEENKELTSLFKKIQEEIEEKKKTLPEQYAQMAVITKYKYQIAKYKDDLAPLMQLLMGQK